MSCTVGIVCDIGTGRERGGRERNEDNFLVCKDGTVRYHVDGVEVTEARSGEGVLVAVCDGMGGHTDGHVAAVTAIRVLSKLYQPGAPKRPAKVLLSFLLDSHRQLHLAARSEGPVEMGTTVTAAWLVDGKCCWAQVGDSRLYLFRNGRLIQLTADQTRNEFARRDGRPRTPDGEHLVQNFIYGSRGMGDNTSLRLEQGLDSGAEVLHLGDRLLLCSDGLTGAVPDEVIALTLARFPEPQACAARLEELALERGSRDNVTAVVVRVDEVPRHDGEEWVDDPEETVQF
jgi:serine/threonine protein phosphatase PrpC